MALNPLNQRVKEIMKHFDLDQTGLANIANVTRQTANGIILGKSKPGASFLTSIIQEFKEIDARWLLTGEGKMFNMSGKHDKNSIAKDTKVSDNDNSVSQETYANLRKDYDFLRNDVEEYKNQIKFLQSLVDSDEVKRKKTD